MIARLLSKLAGHDVCAAPQRGFGNLTEVLGMCIILRAQQPTHSGTKTFGLHCRG